MLILTRKPGESILIGDDIVIKIIDGSKNSVRIGIEAPRDTQILREELKTALTQINLQASQQSAQEEPLAEFHQKFGK